MNDPSLAPPEPGYQQPVQQSSAPLIWLIISIVITLVCCNPLSIVAIIFAALAMSAQGHGDHAKAASHVKVAIILNVIGIVIGIAFVILLFVLGAIGAASGDMAFILPF